MAIASADDTIDKTLWQAVTDKISSAVGVMEQTRTHAEEANTSIATPRRSTTRTRESLLEVQNICLSPDTLAAARKSRLEDIGEESSISLSNRANSESLKEGQEN
ncbi:hypothetical protein OSTOST_19813 [Ostertagia ostertagi]